jgi:hypothetical protein
MTAMPSGPAAAAPGPAAPAAPQINNFQQTGTGQSFPAMGGFKWGTFSPAAGAKAAYSNPNPAANVRGPQVQHADVNGIQAAFAKLSRDIGKAHLKQADFGVKKLNDGGTPHVGQQDPANLGRISNIPSTAAPVKATPSPLRKDGFVQQVANLAKPLPKKPVPLVPAAPALPTGTSSKISLDLESFAKQAAQPGPALPTPKPAAGVPGFRPGPKSLTAQLGTAVGDYNRMYPNGPPPPATKPFPKPVAPPAVKSPVQTTPSATPQATRPLQVQRPEDHPLYVPPQQPPNDSEALQHLGVFGAGPYAEQAAQQQANYPKLLDMSVQGRGRYGKTPVGEEADRWLSPSRTSMSPNMNQHPANPLSRGVSLPQSLGTMLGGMPKSGFDLSQFAKAAAQDNSKPRLSATGESSGLSFKENEDDYDTGLKAWQRSSKYLMRGSRISKEPDLTQGIHQSKSASEPGENCAKCGALFERGEGGLCNSCGKPYDAVKQSVDLSAFVKQANPWLKGGQKVLDGITPWLDDLSKRMWGASDDFAKAPGTVAQKARTMPVNTPTKVMPQKPSVPLGPRNTGAPDGVMGPTAPLRLNRNVNRDALNFRNRANQGAWGQTKNLAQNFYRTPLGKSVTHAGGRYLGIQGAGHGTNAVGYMFGREDPLLNPEGVNAIANVGALGGKRVMLPSLAGSMMAKTYGLDPSTGAYLGAAAYGPGRGLLGKNTFNKWVNAPLKRSLAGWGAGTSADQSLGWMGLDTNERLGQAGGLLGLTSGIPGVRKGLKYVDEALGGTRKEMMEAGSTPFSSHLAGLAQMGPSGTNRFALTSGGARRLGNFSSGAGNMLDNLGGRLANKPGAGSFRQGLGNMLQRGGKSMTTFGKNTVDNIDKENLGSKISRYGLYAGAGIGGANLGVNHVVNRVHEYMGSPEAQQQIKGQMEQAMNMPMEKAQQLASSAEGLQQLIGQFGSLPDMILGPIFQMFGMDGASMHPAMKWALLLGAGGLLGGVMGGGQGSMMGGGLMAALPMVMMAMGMGQGQGQQPAGNPGAPTGATTAYDQAGNPINDPGIPAQRSPEARNELAIQQKAQHGNKITVPGEKLDF